MKSQTFDPDGAGYKKHVPLSSNPLARCRTSGQRSAPFFLAPGFLAYIVDRPGSNPTVVTLNTTLNLGMKIIGESQAQTLTHPSSLLTLP